MVTKPKKNLKNVRSKGFTIRVIISEESLAQHQLCTYKVCDHAVQFSKPIFELTSYPLPFPFCHFSKVTSKVEPMKMEE